MRALSARFQGRDDLAEEVAPSKGFLTGCEWLLLCGLFSLLTLASCRKDAAASAVRAVEPRILARAGSDVLSDAEFAAEAKRRGVGTDPAQRKALLEEMLEDLRLLAYAREQGLDRDPEVKRSHEALLVSKAREALGVEAEALVPLPSESELQEAYNARRESLATPVTVRVAMIYNRNREAMDHAVKAAGELPPAGRGFGAVAAAWSEDQATRHVDGDFGDLVAGHADGVLPDEALAAVFALKTPGELSPVVESADGFRLFRLMARTESVIPPYAKVRPRLLSELSAGRRREAESAAARRIAALPGESFPEHLAKIQ